MTPCPKCELRAMLKLLWYSIRQSFGYTGNLVVTTLEADVLMQWAAENGDREMLVAIQTGQRHA